MSTEHPNANDAGRDERDPVRLRTQGGDHGAPLPARVTVRMPRSNSCSAPRLCGPLQSGNLPAASARSLAPLIPLLTGCASSSPVQCSVRRSRPRPATLKRSAARRRSTTSWPVPCNGSASLDRLVSIARHQVHASSPNLAFLSPPARAALENMWVSGLIWSM